MAYIFTIIFTSKLVLVEMACLLGIQNKMQALWAVKTKKKKKKTFLILQKFDLDTKPFTFETSTAMAEDLRRRWRTVAITALRKDKATQFLQCLYETLKKLANDLVVVERNCKTHSSSQQRLVPDLYAITLISLINVGPTFTDIEKFQPPCLLNS